MAMTGLSMKRINVPASAVEFNRVIRRSLIRLLLLSGLDRHRQDIVRERAVDGNFAIADVLENQAHDGRKSHVHPARGDGRVLADSGSLQRGAIDVELHATD